jgi:hypothetical protein
VSSEMGYVGFAVGREVSVAQGYARSVLARDVEIRYGGAGSIVASNVRFEAQSGAFMVLARRVDGNVRTVLDWRGALVAAAVLGVTIGLLARRKHS